MSKARELLRRVISTYSDYGINTLYGEINELLAQPEQEPVAWMYDTYEEGYREKYDCLTTIEDYISNTGVTNVRPLYTSPPKREPLSDEEIFAIGYKAGFAIDSIERDLAFDYGFLDEDGGVDNEPYFKLVRAIEKAHGIGVKDE